MVEASFVCVYAFVGVCVCVCLCGCACVCALFQFRALFHVACDVGLSYIVLFCSMSVFLSLFLVTTHTLSHTHAHACTCIHICFDTYTVRRHAEFRELQRMFYNALVEAELLRQPDALATGADSLFEVREGVV